MLVYPPKLTLTQGFGDKDHHGPLRPPNIFLGTIGEHPPVFSQFHLFQARIGLFNQSPLACHGQGRHIVDAGIVHGALIGLGHIAFVVNNREGFEVLLQVQESLLDAGQDIGEGFRIRPASAINLAQERNPLAFIAEQRHANLTQVMPFLLVMASPWELAMGVLSGDEGEKVGGIVEKGIERDLIALDGFLHNVFFDEGKGLDGNLIHLVPEMLTGEGLQIHTRKRFQGGGFCPLGEGHFTCGVADAVDADKLQGMTGGKSVMEKGFTQGIFEGRVLASVPSSEGGHVPIDRALYIELLCQGMNGGDGAVGMGSETEGLGTLDAGEDIVGFSKMEEDKDAWLAINPPGLDNAPVAMPFDFDALEAGHMLVYTLSIVRNQGRHT